MLIYDLLLSTRRQLPTGIERFAINAFRASAESGSGAIAIVQRGTNLVAGLDVIEIDSGMRSWLGMGLHIRNRIGTGTHNLVCAAFPPSPSMLGRRFSAVRVLHDAFPWTRAADMPWKGRLLLRDYENMLLKRYGRVYAPTKIARDEIVRALNTETAIGVCGNAPGLLFHGIQEPVVGLTHTPFLLLVGSVEPRKNYEAILSLLRRDAFKDHRVVIAGRPGWGDVVDRLSAEAQLHPDALIWLQEASDANLRWLYSHCACFLALSHAEGFNMPLVEAGTFGARILATDLPIHRDVAPNNSVFIDMHAGSQAIMSGLQKALAEPPLQNVAKYQSRFSWTQIAQVLDGSSGGEFE